MYSIFCSIFKDLCGFVDRFIIITLKFYIVNNFFKLFLMFYLKFFVAVIT